MIQDFAALDREAEQIVKDIGIPPCPAILTRLLREMREDEPDMQKTGTLIGSDVGLAAAMLKTVNSPFYGLRSKASSVMQALVLLGLRNVGQLVTGLLLRQAFPVANSEQMEDFWESSSRTAMYSAHLAGKVRGVSRDDAYTFGLFRDCAVPLMMRKFRDYYETHDAAARAPDKSVTEVEQELYAVDHTRIGWQLANSWELPEGTCQAILHHHDYARVFSEEVEELPGHAVKLIAVALVAEQLFRSLSAGTACPEWKKAGTRALEVLGMSEGDLKTAAVEVGKLS
jgi:HD-like signal output (HDOD) protein